MLSTTTNTISRVTKSKSFEKYFHLFLFLNNLISSTKREKETHGIEKSINQRVLKILTIACRKIICYCLIYFSKWHLLSIVPH
mmetsp:Transcript_19817/g.21548  ORF Transcript_19817/g.21548 Transcript_19817/m.21548 type:complete len:83 (+) Transcript_19817:192-440(+)